VEVTDEPAVVPGDEVVLIGRQGDQVVTAQEWAERLGTIAYEIVCGFGPRLDRRHTSEGRPV
jgi:alanine racemase